MKFNKLVDSEIESDFLKSEMKAGRRLGIISLGDSHLFFRKGLKNYFISYSNIECAFRRVFMVPARMCCGKGEIPVENLVLMNSGKEIAEIGLPGLKAAKEVIEILKEKAPNATFECPKDESNE